MTRIDAPTLRELLRRMESPDVKWAGRAFFGAKIKAIVLRMVAESEAQPPVVAPGWGGVGHEPLGMRVNTLTSETLPVVRLDGTYADGTRYASNGSPLPEDPDPTEIMSHTEFQLARAAGHIAPALKED